MKFNTKEQNVFFTSDPHYSHKNICAGVSNWVKPFGFVPKPDDDRKYIIWPVPYSEWKDTKERYKFCIEHGMRDYPTIEKMDSTIINHFNEKVGQSDVLFILGDIGFGGKDSVSTFMKQLVCKNVHLIYGNHDKDIIQNRDGIRGYFKSCERKQEIYVDDQFITLDHYAGRVWNKSHRGAWLLYGHSHGSLEYAPWGKSMDVGVDTNDMYPYSFFEIKKIMDSRKTESIDHHRD